MDKQFIHHNHTLHKSTCFGQDTLQNKHHNYEDHFWYQHTYHHNMQGHKHISSHNPHRIIHNILTQLLKAASGSTPWVFLKIQTHIRVIRTPQKMPSSLEAEWKNIKCRRIRLEKTHCIEVPIRRTMKTQYG